MSGRSVWQRLISLDDAKGFWLRQNAARRSKLKHLPPQILLPPILWFRCFRELGIDVRPDAVHKWLTHRESLRGKRREALYRLADKKYSELEVLFGIERGVESWPYVPGWEVVFSTAVALAHAPGRTLKPDARKTRAIRQNGFERAEQVALMLKEAARAHPKMLARISAATSGEKRYQSTVKRGELARKLSDDWAPHSRGKSKVPDQVLLKLLSYFVKFKRGPMPKSVPAPDAST